MNRLANPLTTTLRLTLALGLALTAIACSTDAPVGDQVMTTEWALEEEPATVAPTVQSVCVPITIGGPDNCKPQKFWAKRAEKTCGDLGLQVAKLELHKRCTKTRFTGADVLCCNEEAQECVIDMVGSKKDCKTEAAWTAIATSACMDQGKSLTHITAGVACDGGHRFARYECCGAVMTCEQGTSWNDQLNACCPDAVWIADCWCAPGWEYTSEDVYDEYGCMLGTGCGCEPPKCDDGGELLCDMMPPECSGGLVLAIQGGCYECVDAESCQVPGGCLSNDDCDDGQSCQWDELCPLACTQEGCPPCYGTCVDDEPEQGCYGDEECPEGTTCNAAEVCMSPPGCEPGQACPTVCYGWCVDDSGCQDDWEWNAELDACCPDVIYMPSCAMCPNGAFPEVVEVYNEDGCLEGYTCSCDGGSCDDGGEVMCDMMPPECPEGLVVAAQNGCFECVDPNTCQVPGQTECIISGCSGQICAPEPVTTTCEWTEAYACYAYSECGHFGPNGTCGWAETDLYLECLADIGNETCSEDESWDANLDACCPDFLYTADCVCENGGFPSEVEEYDANGCLLGYGCQCGGPCDDESQAVCLMMPPECPEGTILAVKDGCFSCVDPDTCEPPGVDPGCVVSGCSGEICDTQSMNSVCLWKPEYACLEFTSCGMAADGTCGWDMNQEYLDCLEEAVGSQCDEGESWDGTVDACCPDAVWAETCACPDGSWVKETTEYDANGCLLGYGCECVSGEGCTYDGMSLEPGAEVEAIDGCNTCVCMDSGEMQCSQVPCAAGCEDETGQYSPGDSWDAPDGCNTCICMEGGEIACTKMLCPEGCLYEGEWYGVGDGFPASDGCNTCTCTENGQVACTLMACVEGCSDETGSYLPGESWDAADGCNVCTCMDNGEAACTKMLCPDGCTYDGEWYASGTTFPANDGCNSCWCADNGNVACTLMLCPETGCSDETGQYSPGDIWEAADGCNTCNCLDDGTIACTEMACQCSPDEEWWREYVGTSPEMCMVIDYGCAENMDYFSNACGCGCEQSAECPQWLNCMPSPGEGGCSEDEIKDFEALCPLSGIAW